MTRGYRRIPSRKELAISLSVVAAFLIGIFCGILIKGAEVDDSSKSSSSEGLQVRDLESSRLHPGSLATADRDRAETPPGHGSAAPVLPNGGDRVSVPETALRYFMVPGLWSSGALIQESIREAFGLSESEAADIEDAARVALDKIATTEAELFEVKVDAAGDEYLFVPAFGETGQKLKREFEEALRECVGVDTAKLLLQGMTSSKEFAEFGERARHLSIIERKARDGEPIYFFEQKYLNQNGEISGGGEIRISAAQMNHFKRRYGRLDCLPNWITK